MEGYWPWWLGASVLAAITVGYTAASGRPFGVSGLLGRLLNWREERGAEKVQRYLADQRDAVRDALVRATREKFTDQERAPVETVASSPREVEASPPPPVPISYGLTFIIFLILGGLFSSLLRGDSSFTLDLGASFSRLVGEGPRAVALLLLGGTLVGMGTRMAGGCTSGHGLSGCARMRPASLVATAAFFGTGVAVSFLLGAL